MGKWNAVVRPKAVEIMVFPPCEGVLGNGVRDVPEAIENSEFFGIVCGGDATAWERRGTAEKQREKCFSGPLDQVIVCVSVLLLLTA